MNRNSERLMTMACLHKSAKKAPLKLSVASPSADAARRMTHTIICGMWVRGPATETNKSSFASPEWPMNASPPRGHSRMPSTMPPIRYVAQQWPSS